MSTTPTAPSTFTSQSNFLPILHAALESYKRKTKKNVAHPLLPSLQSCESPEGVLTVVREQVLAFSAHQNRDGGLTKWVVPTANVLYSFSETIGRVALAFLPAAKDASASRDNLIDISNHIEYFFRRLEMYTSVTLTTAMNDIIVEIMVEVLTFLAIVRKKAKPPKRGLIKKKYQKLMGDREIEDNLERLNKLTKEEAQMAFSEQLRMNHSVDDRVRGVEGQVQDDRGDMQDVGNKVQDADDGVQGIDSNVRGVDDNLDQARRREQEKRDGEELEKQRFDTVVQNAGQLKIYRHLYSFLVEKFHSMKTLDPRLESLLPRLCTHFENFANYGIVVSISESRQFRETLLEASLMFGDDGFIVALDEDEKEICALLQEVLLNSEDKSTIRSLHGERAKFFMQVLQGALERGSPSLQEDRLQRTAQQILIDLSKACGDADRKAKIADFGFANFVEMSVSYSAVRMGSPRSMAPELLDTSQKFQRTTKSDIFAFACIAFEIYTGAPIFNDNDYFRACRRIMAGERPRRPADGQPMPDRMWDLIEWCWSHDPSSRPQIDDVVKKMREL